MSPTLAPELWTHILAFLPYTCLDTAKRVNRVFYQICRDRIFEVLDLVPTFTDDNVDKQLDILKKRLSIARNHTHLIKKVRFMPTVRLPLYYTPKNPLAKPVRMLKRLFTKTDAPTTPTGRSGIHPSYMKAWEVDTALATLLPSLTSLEELFIGDSSIWYEVWGPNAKLALNVAASHLTVLFLQYPVISGPGLIPINYDETNIPLPALRILRLHLEINPNDDYESRARKIISGSPLLTEIEYHLTSSIVHNNVPSFPIGPTTHPNLKTIKWTFSNQMSSLLQPWATTLPLTPLITSHAFQFDVVYLNPAPSFAALESLNIRELVELRVDLNAQEYGVNFFTLIAPAENLVTLEVTGFRYTSAANDPATLFPEVGLGRLRRLYVGIALEFFNVRTLRAFASKVPDLRKLVLLIEPWNSAHWTPASLQVKCDGLLYEFDLSAATTSFPEWKLWDFGILFRNWTGGIIDFESVMMAISRRVPSITSFYGTGGLRLWAGMENDIDENWAGELWNRRQPGWPRDAAPYIR
ncbi:hypothetical protein DL96DRAFT_1823775 [Flagelloscypha sp. PMI_526]|nr:hypothetical protein DL96DRAFT_1823775 [Flagelloscypha sp. PMI_526]